MRPRDAFRVAVVERLEELGWPADDAVVERPADPSHGDLAAPVALALARPLRMPPRAIADRLVAGLELDPAVFDAPTVAGPGFVNVRLAPGYLRSSVERIFADPAGYGRSERLSGHRVNVEFVSSNPTGPLHVGHARNAALGDALAALLESQGATPTREYYFNDAGRQMDVLAASVHARYEQRWDADHPFPEDGYRGAYIRELAEALAAEAGERYRGRPADALEELGRFAGDRLSDGIRADLARFRVAFDVWFNESTLYRDGRLERTIDELRAADAVYERDGATWFRATAHGDDEDRVLVKRTGQPTYLLPDIAYHLDKRDRGFDVAIDVWGADHHGYQVRMHAALAALGLPTDWLRVVIYQQVSLVEDGQEVRLSTRRNRMVTLAELMDDIGVDVARYFLLMRKSDTHMVFDLDLARRQSDENPVYYVQYAYARITGVFENLDAPELHPDRGIDAAVLELLDADSEAELLRTLEDWPDVVADATDALEPHRITDALEELARRFHLWYHDRRILVDDEPLARARLALARATGHVLANGLGLLGVEAPESM